MELLGNDLENFLKANGPLSPDVAADVGIQVVIYNSQLFHSNNYHEYYIYNSQLFYSINYHEYYS